MAQLIVFSKLFRIAPLSLLRMSVARLTLYMSVDRLIMYMSVARLTLYMQNK